MIKLDVASNTKRKGWICIDVESNSDLQVDIMNNTLPFDLGIVDAIYSSHTLEHIWPDRLPFVLSEFRRVLKDGAPIRVVVPDFDIALNAFLNKDYQFLDRTRIPVPESMEMPLQHLTSWFFSYYLEQDGTRSFGHLNAFNRETLSAILKKSGFRNVKLSSFGECFKEFEGCDLLGHKETSLYLEAVK